jgi:hypothetical protein
MNQPSPQLHPVDQAFAEARAKATAKRPWRQYRDPRPGEVEAWLATHANTIKRENGKRGLELRFNPCPVCGRDSKRLPGVLINADSGMWYCHAKGCAGNWFMLTRAFGDPLPEADRYADDPYAINIGEAHARVATARRKAPSLVTSNKYPALLDYCHKRGISNATLDECLVTSLGDSCVRWPMHAWGDDGKWHLVNAKIKRCIENPNATGPKSWFEVSGGPTGLFVGQHLVHARHGERVIITEGEWDYMAGHTIGLRNVVSLPNGASHVHVASMLRYIPDDWEVWLCTDNDEPGNRCAELFYAQLGFERVARIMMPHKDLNAWLMAEPTLTPAQVLAQAKGVTTLVGWRAQQPNANERKYMRVGMSVAMDLAANRIVCETPWPGLTARLGGGFRAGQTTGLLAPSGVGKSTIVNQVLIDAAAKGHKVGLISVEGDRTELDANITQAITGWTGHAPGSEGFAAVAGNMLISELEGHTVPWQACIDEFQAMIDQGAKLLALDNLDFIMPRNDMRMHDVKTQAYAALIEQARNNHAHTVVVWQPKKVDRNATINSGNQKGLSQTFQDADNYINVNTQGACRRLEVEKCRKVGVVQGDNAVLIRYQGSKRCLTEVASDDKDAINSQWTRTTKDL